MRGLTRRSFLHGSATLPLLLGEAASALASDAAPSRLIADPKRILDLPPGFSYRILSRTGSAMSDGYRVPGNPDAMGVFPLPGGKLALMRNHELFPGDGTSSAYAAGQAPAEAYDPGAFGGVTRLVLDEKTLSVERENLVLAGTHWNCAGGLSPWGWLSCEEIFAPHHGYVFLCPTDADHVAPARPIKTYGRFRHEAATVDPETQIAYLTEDRDDAAFYRFVPRQTTEPFVGTLQALAITGQPGFDTNNMALRDRLSISWVDVPDADPTEDNVRLQARQAGAARFVRTEGLWLAGQDAYICATTGGPIGRGQIFRLRHRPAEHAELTLIAHATDTALLDMPDNLTVSPSGQIYVAEDGLDGNFLRRITLDGGVVDFARNALSASEFAGPCFTPDGKTLFVNIQHDGLTLAISGPFENELGVDARHSAVRARKPPSLRDGLPGLGGGLAVLALAALARRKRQAKAKP